MLNTQINRIYNFSYQENNYPSELKELALLILNKFDKTTPNLELLSKTKGDKINLLTLSNKKISIYLSPILQYNSYLLNISFIPEAIDKNELLLLLNKYSEYFMDLETILTEYHSHSEFNNTILLYDASFSGTDIPDERLITIFKRILNRGDENLILLLCSSVIMENPLYYEVFKAPIQNALAKNNSPILDDTYKEVLSFIEDYS